MNYQSDLEQVLGKMLKQINFGGKKRIELKTDDETYNNPRKEDSDEESSDKTPDLNNAKEDNNFDEISSIDTDNELNKDYDLQLNKKTSLKTKPKTKKSCDCSHNKYLNNDFSNGADKKEKMEDEKDELSFDSDYSDINENAVNELTSENGDDSQGVKRREDKKKEDFSQKVFDDSFEDNTKTKEKKALVKRHQNMYRNSMNTLKIDFIKDLGQFVSSIGKHLITYADLRKHDLEMQNIIKTFDN